MIVGGKVIRDLFSVLEVRIRKSFNQITALLNMKLKLKFQALIDRMCICVLIHHVFYYHVAIRNL